MIWISILGGLVLAASVWLFIYCNLSVKRWSSKLSPEEIIAVRKSGRDEGF